MKVEENQYNKLGFYQDERTTIMSVIQELPWYKLKDKEIYCTQSDNMFYRGMVERNLVLFLDSEAGKSLVCSVEMIDDYDFIHNNFLPKLEEHEKI